MISSGGIPYADLNVGAVKSWAVDRNLEAVKGFNFPRFPSADYWPGISIYQIQVDRFNNGNRSNDDLNLPQYQKDAMERNSMDSLPDWRHGGDLEGIRQRIPYFVDMGINAVWLTPVLKHDGSYHGYCLTDPTKIDPGFGTDEEFRQLVAELHKAGIYVFMDIVVNHMCDPKSKYTTYADHNLCTQKMHDFHWGGYPGNGGGQANLEFSDGFFPAFRNQFFFNRCGANSYEEMSGDGPAAVYGDFAPGMYDFDTRNYDFQEVFTEIHKYWIAYADIDGFRLDAAKHVTEDFTAYFSTYIRDYANSLGKKNFYLVGEVAASSEWQAQRLGNMYMNPLNPDQHGNIAKGAVNRVWTFKDVYLRHPIAKYPGLNSIYDFNQGGRSREVMLSQKPASWIAQYIGSDDYNRIAGQVPDPKVFWTLLEIHDWPRLLQQTPNDGGRAYVGLGHLLSMQGMPIIYYGLEQGFNGNCDMNRIKAGNSNQAIIDNCNSWSDSRKRQDMFVSGPYKLGSAVSEIQELAFIGNSQNSSVDFAWDNDPMLKRDHYLYQMTKKLLRIRKSCAALTSGATYFRESGGNIDDLIVFSRVNQISEAVVVINPKGTPIYYQKVLVDAALNANSNGVKYINLLNPQQVGYIGYENGKTYLYFSGSGSSGPANFNYRSVSIFVHQNAVGLYLPDLGINLCK